MADTEEPKSEEVEKKRSLFDIATLVNTRNDPVDNVREKLIFREHLVISRYYRDPLSSQIYLTLSNAELEAVGGLVIDVEFAGPSDEHFLVFCSSQLVFHGNNGGSQITSWVNRDLHTVEEKRTEFIQTDMELVDEKQCYAVMEKDHYYVIGRSRLETSFQKYYYGFDKTKDLVCEGANFVLMRYLAVTNFIGTIEMTTLYINGDLCRNIYVSTGIEGGIINNTKCDITKIRRIIMEKCGIVHNCVTTFLRSGRIVRQEWENCLFLFHLNPLVEVDINNPDKLNNFPLQYSWQTDMQLFSKYLDYKVKRLAKHKSYMTDHPEIKELISDYVQDILLKKPCNILEHTIHFFGQFAPKDLPYSFTDLSEKYNRSGKGGPSRLTQVLNSYIGAMVQEILSHNGDVLKFSGDAFLAMWKSGENDSMSDVVHEALDCALIIQKSYGTFLTDVGVTLKVKLAISAGHVVFSLIGDSKMSHYVVVGQPIWDVKAAEYQTSAGEIVVSPSAWQYLNPNEYISEGMRDGRHIKVLGMGASWKSTQRSQIRYQRDVIDEIIDDDDDEGEDLFSPTYAENEVAGLKSDHENVPVLMRLNTEIRGSVVQDEFTLRPSVNKAAKMKIKVSLKRFIIAPVMRGIDLDEPLEYLTEMRQVVILFINVVTLEKSELEDFVRLVDTAFKLVCGVVNENQGCVNKVSLFDKDLMMLCIFGLRGFKNNLESQIGLRCASECRAALSALPNVKTASIGVTTGMTYCGVVGHPLRREYTVISITVNKGARLMVAYPDKVSCDRETFLHSKLEARNFILQEPKELKGLSSVGPIYEFKEQTMIPGVNNAVSPFPLLGRDEEIKLYVDLLSSIIRINDLRRQSSQSSSEFNYNSLIIRGEARQGKSRLLDELVFATPKELPVNRFTLQCKDSKMPFATLQLIFAIPLGLADLPTTQQREERLIHRLRKVKVPQLLCALNELFYVNFEITDFYKNLSHQQREKVKKKMVEHLVSSCFSTLWVIAIDDGEYIDDESWPLLPTILELNRVFLIITVGCRRPLPPIAEITISYTRLKVVVLSPIAKWYHAGLACQILDVQAIPPELEKMIQTRSNGNPGWVESYLVSLIQAGGVLIRSIPKEDVLEMGLVTTPINMMVRLSEEEKLEYERLQKSPGCSATDIRKDGWKMYQHSYRDSIGSLSELALAEKHSYRSHIIPICTLAPNFNLEEVDPEVAMDVMILRTFDSLTSYEQLLLKCSAVLGEIFLRNMLVFIMSATSPRLTSLAVMKLFEIRVLACARGDFTHGDRFMMNRYRFIDPNEEVGIKCDCIGNKIDDTCKDLPKYASCGYLRFKLSMFRETTYTLLTDNQKKEFHNRAIRYLEKETRRCNACGNGFFVRVLGLQSDDGLRPRRMFDDELSVMLENRSESAAGLPSSNILDSLIESESFLMNHHQRINTRRTTIGDIYSFRKASKKGCFQFNSFNVDISLTALTRTFSTADFTECQCPLILNSMYTQMLDHCKGAGRVEKLMEAILEYAFLCISDCNIPLAIKLLDDAHGLLDAKPKDEDEDTTWGTPIIRGKINTLVGYAQLELGQVEGAFKALHMAMKNFGYPFPTSYVGVKLATKCQLLRQQVMLKFCPVMYVRSLVGDNAEFCDNLSHCLSLLCDLFKSLQVWDMAELAAVWSLNESLRSDLHFRGLCKAYADVLEVSHRLGKLDKYMRLEKLALQLCHRKTTKIESQELQAVAYLYTAIFYSRFLRAHIDGAINLGYVIMRLTATIHAPTLSLKVLPHLIHALVMKKRFSEAMSMLSELNFLAEEDSDNSGRTWFFALCVQFHLETGFVVLQFKNCEMYFNEEGECMITLRDPEAERRFFTCMWLWSLRNEFWDMATIWYARIQDFLLTGDSLSSMFSALCFLEGLIMYLVSRVESHNVSLVRRLQLQITSGFKRVEKNVKYAAIILPRYLHLKSYYRFVTHNDKKAEKLLAAAKKAAEESGNISEIGWINHNELFWKGNLSPVLTHMWQDTSHFGTTRDWHEIAMNGDRLSYYSLPLPRHPIKS